MKWFRLLCILIFCTFTLNGAEFNEFMQYSRIEFDSYKDRKREIENIETVTLCITQSYYPNCYVYQVTQDRNLIIREFDRDYDYFNDPGQIPITTTERILSEEEYTKLIDSIINNSFMTLPKKINNNNIYDGGDVHMEVKMNGVSHRVGGYMPQYLNDRFKNIYEQFEKIIYRKPEDLDPAENNTEIKFDINVQNKRDDTIKINNLKIEINNDTAKDVGIVFEINGK